MIRCDACGATNGETADWCGQCYAPLARATDQAPAPATAPAPEQAVAEGVGVGVGGAEAGDPVAEGFRRRGGTVEWECPACGAWSTMETLACGVCETPLSARWLHTDPDDGVPATGRLDEPWTLAFALSAVVPGAGHIGLRHYGSGLARAVLFAVWLMGGVALLLAGGALAGAPLLLGAAVLWAGSLLDIAALRAGRREVLGGRSLLWVVVAVLLLSMVSVVAAALQTSAAGPTGVG